MRGNLFVFSGPSGVGKGTLRAELFRRVSGLAFSISCTTRPPRIGETDGVDYRFIDEKSFQRHVDNDDFLEWADVHGHRYGTLASDVERMRDQGKDVMLEIDVQGAMQVKKLCPGAHFIFVAPPTLQDLEQRLRGRGTETEEDVRRRLHNASGELEQERFFDLIVVNDEIEKAVDQLERFILDCRGGNQ